MGFMEVHHIKPLSTLNPGGKTTLDDLALLCANCHRMVHAQRPWLSMEELKTLVQASQADVSGP
jgi:5-methylcytosine-specific restriction protein A